MSSSIPSPSKAFRIPAASSEPTNVSNNLNNDCKYYFSSDGCALEGDCEYRHSEAAKGCWTMCEKWSQGKCEEGALCPKRHMRQKTLLLQRRKFYSNDDGGKIQNGEKNGNVEGGQVPKQRRVECPICFESLFEVRDVDLQFCAFIECGHVVCEPCADNLLKKEPALCPICRCDIDEQPLNIYL